MHQANKKKGKDHLIDLDRSFEADVLFLTTRSMDVLARRITEACLDGLPTAEREVSFQTACDALRRVSVSELVLAAPENKRK